MSSNFSVIPTALDIDPLHGIIAAHMAGRLCAARYLRILQAQNASQMGRYAPPEGPGDFFRQHRITRLVVLVPRRLVLQPCRKKSLRCNGSIARAVGMSITPEQDPEELFGRAAAHNGNWQYGAPRPAFSPPLLHFHIVSAVAPETAHRLEQGDVGSGYSALLPVRRANRRVPLKRKAQAPSRDSPCAVLPLLSCSICPDMKHQIEQINDLYLNESKNRARCPARPGLLSRPNTDSYRNLNRCLLWFASAQERLSPCCEKQTGA